MSDFQEIRGWLENFPFLTKEDYDFFEPFLTLKKIGAQEVVFAEGQVCREMAFVNSGAFRLYYLADGKEINSHFFLENEFMADFNSFLQEKPSRYFLQALEPSEIVTFDSQLLQNAYDSSKNWERFGRLMAEYSYKITVDRVESFLFMDGKERYLKLLESRPHIFERVPLYHIASYLGMERESLSRIRKKITQERRM
ncbi:MAG: Crp/Fnr family transcriptional regulator [Chlorobium sp.]|nr:MAG: Crp/Fnr family transcriptional regulator [Chlorobium sp.]